MKIISDSFDAPEIEPQTITCYQCGTVLLVEGKKDCRVSVESRDEQLSDGPGFWKSFIGGRYTARIRIEYFHVYNSRCPKCGSNLHVWNGPVFKSVTEDRQMWIGGSDY